MIQVHLGELLQAETCSSSDYQLATCFNKIDLPAFTDRVMAALEDVNEIKVLGLMLLLRLGQLSPSSVVPRLDAAVEIMKGMMKNVEVKDDTILQDIERKGEAVLSDCRQRR